MSDYISPARHDLELDLHDRGTAAHLTAPAWVHAPRVPAATAGIGNRRPLLFVHGFRGDHHGMDLIAHHLPAHPVMVPDLPGFGLAPPLPGGLTLEGYVAFVDAAVRAVEAEYGQAPIVVGHSFGSVLAAHWAADHPRASALVLINPIASSALEGPARVGTQLARAYYALGRALPPAAGSALLSNPGVVRVMSEVMAATSDPGLRRYIHDQHARHFSAYADRASLAQAFDISVAHTAAEVSARLVMPVLVIAGNRDQIAPLGPTQQFIADLPNSTARIFDGVGHLIHYERPEATAQAIAEFVADIDAVEAGEA
ncbi:alpha/beta hydrolase [Brevibacterium sp. BRM-1]|uniref:alpha/beta fold hydrolase n=1 Tax=Brevibacterium sp. BRM-1 TaxID=2999062 RepID=UPI0022806ABE|nr:alpha/beta hydrolase [Brevibacterium sp. BRM-1]WAL40623.1 alpha/beta hydrolase [Brevibacterium sp. BRM-1]